MLNEMLKLNILIMANFFFKMQIIYCTKCFPWITISFNPCNPEKYILLLSPFIDDEIKIQRC